MPDPGAEATFASARLSWSWPEGTFRAGLRRLYRDLLAARREWPALRDFEHRSARFQAGPDGGLILELGRGADEAGSVRALFNLGDQPVPMPEISPAPDGGFCSARNHPGTAVSRPEWERRVDRCCRANALCSGSLPEL